jgi:hypothetical protein
MPLTTFLNDGTVSQLRGAAWLALSDVGQVGEGTVTDDSGGGGSVTWAYGTDVPCRLDPITSNESLMAGRVNDRSTHLITVPPNLTVLTSSRFAITGRGTFEITAVRERTGEQLRFLEAVEIF